MSRVVCALIAVAFLSAGFIVLAGSDAASPTKADAVTFTAVKTAKGDAIQVTVGDIAFEVPSLELKRNDQIRVVLVAGNGQLNTIVPLDPGVHHRAEDLQGIAITGKSYSLPIRKPSSSAYYLQDSH
jgi:hypothetical protein